MQYKINTSLPIQFEEIENPPYLNDSRFQAIRCYVAHEKDNYNGSWFDTSTLEKMGKNMAGVPIVGYISVDNNNKKDFNGHEERLVIQDGEVTFEYLGRAYGCIISNDDVEIVQRMHESGEMRNYLAVTGVLWKMFTDSIEIFDRDTSKPHSMELQEDSISGKFEKDGFYHFTDCKVRALCILGDGVPPAMSNSLIEKFSISNCQNQVQELLTEINESIKQFTLKNQSSTNPDVDDINNSNAYEKEVNDIVKDKEELLAKYNLTAEQLNFSIDEISVEELETKVNEHFALLASQKEEEISNALRADKYIDRWGDECSKYSYVNHTDSEVFAYDRQDNWKLCGFMYTMNGDNVVIDFATKKRKKFQIVDFEDGAIATEFSLFPQEALDYAVSDKEKELKQQFTTDKETALNKIQTKLDEVTTEYEQIKPEFTRLQEFESTTLSTQRKEAEDTLFSQFEQLNGNEEFEQLKQNTSEFTLEQLEKEIALIFVKVGTGIKFSAKPTPKPKEKVKIEFTKNNNDEPTGEFDDLFNKYLKKE